MDHIRECRSALQKESSYNVDRNGNIMPVWVLITDDNPRHTSESSGLIETDTIGVGGMQPYRLVSE